MRALACAVVLLGASALAGPVAAQTQRPNIVLMFPDNLGWGEVGAYGAVRGVPTPNVDSIAAVRAVKWKDWKFHYAFMPEPRVTEPPLMRLFNLRSDPREESDIKDVNP